MKKLHPRSVWLFFIRLLTVWFIAFVFLGMQVGLSNLFQSQNNDIEVIGQIGNFATIGMVLLFFILFIWANLSYKFYGYQLTDEGFKKESGVIAQSSVTIPYDRIQNVDIYRSLWARLLGLSDVRIQTAGSSRIGAEGRLPGLSEQEAQKVRDELILRAKQAIKQGL